MTTCTAPQIPVTAVEALGIVADGTCPAEDVTPRILKGTSVSSEIGRTELAEFGSAWRSVWPNRQPIANELPYTAASSWVRFYSLPEGKRYATDRHERDVILMRHFTILRELCSMAATTADDLRVVTVAWAGSAEPVSRWRKVARNSPSSAYWKAVPYDQSDPEDEAWMHLYLGRVGINEASLRALLVLVANDVTNQVLICPPNASWLYHPYDGGADVFTWNDEIRNTIRTRYAEWLPENSGG